MKFSKVKGFNNLSEGYEDIYYLELTVRSDPISQCHCRTQNTKTQLNMINMLIGP